MANNHIKIKITGVVNMTISETLNKLQDTYGFFSQKTLNEMVAFHKIFKNHTPIKDNMMNIEYGLIIPEIRKKGEVDGLFYGSLACLGENKYGDWYHDYSRIVHDDKIIHVVDFNPAFEVFTCWTNMLVDHSGLICLALQELTPFKDFLFMHELGHIVKIINGYPLDKSFELGQLEESIANSLAIRAFAQHIGKPDDYIIDNYYNPLIAATIKRDIAYPDFDMARANEFYGNMKDDITIILDFLTDQLEER